MTSARARGRRARSARGDSRSTMIRPAWQIGGVGAGSCRGAGDGHQTSRKRVTAMPAPPAPMRQPSTVMSR
jgi:hypothetical protein